MTGQFLLTNAKKKNKWDETRPYHEKNGCYVTKIGALEIANNSNYYDNNDFSTGKLIFIQTKITKLTKKKMTFRKSNLESIDQSSRSLSKIFIPSPETRDKN